MGKYGDEDGMFWLPTPGSGAGQGTIVKPGRSQGARQPRVHVPRGPVPESDWTAPIDFPRLSGVVAMDWETNDPDLKNVGSNWCRPGIGDVAGFALAWGSGMDGGERYYPVAHAGGGNLDREPCLRYVRDVVTSPDVQLVCHNMLYDIGWTWGRLGYKPARVPWDTQIAVALLDEYRQRNNQGYNLNACARDYAGVLKDETLLQQAAEYFGLHAKNDLWKLHAKYVGPYAETDAGDTLLLWQAVEPMLHAEGLWDLFLLECRYAMVATAMRMRGIRVNTDRAERFRDELKRREAEATARVRTLVGFEVPVWESAALAKAFDKRGIPYPKTDLGAPSFTAPWLKTIDDPLARDVLSIRRWEKARGTFVEGFFLKLATNGRIYPQINPLPTDDAGTVSGRSSCSNPNVQQLSAKDLEMAHEVRGLCLPEEGAQWAALDYSQQEPRIAVHFAYLADVPGAKAIVDQYRSNPHTDFHKMVAKLANIDRGPAKILNLAIIYGKGEAATCHELGFETEWISTRNGKREVAGPEGKAFIEAYHRIVPFVSGLKEACKRAVRKKGYIRTLLGRRCRFGEGKSKDHTAVNRLVQGSAADQLKKASVDMYEQLGEVPLVQVHDEAGINKWSDEQVRRVQQCMLDATPLEVPMVVDIAVGEDWGQAL